jgi:hypothetical protein
LWLTQFKVIDDPVQNFQPVIDQATQSMAFKIGEKLVLTPDFNKLQVTSLDFSDCGNVMARVLGLLSHTPVRAVLTGFMFTCTPEEEAKLPSMQTVEGFVGVQSTFVSPIQDGLVQLAVRRQQGADMVLAVNIQRNVSDAKKAAECAAAWAQEKEMAINIIQKIFKVEPV